MSGRGIYLGDGVYASFDGYQIKLSTTRENGDRDDVIYIEPALWHALKQFAKDNGMEPQA